MSPEPPPSGDAIKQLTETVSTFVRWVAELIVSRNWFTLLILVAIALLFLFKPEGGIAVKGLTVVLGIESLPPWYGTLFWTVEAGLILGALVIAVRTMPRATQQAAVNIPDYKAIKGLRPFTHEDAEVFAQLQRQSHLRECLDSVTSPGFRFGILHGVSGCGKTSFLQAGLVPQLSTSATHRGVYVRLGGQDPVQAIASAVSTTLEVPSDWLLTSETTDFCKLLETALKAAEKPLILFLDQFEQFFVFYPREEQRQPFVQALTEWYNKAQALPVALVVAVRSDLLYQLDELHKALGYALGPQEVFRLEKFTPVETTNVLKAIAQLENLSFDARFITELAEAELADRDDGRISPVDVQILAWMIEQQPQGELRAFDRNAFQKFGGVEGLLQRFLERTLDARMLPNQRQTALKVLLALTDLDRQVRAGVLTLAELQAKLKETVAADDVEEAVQWLARGDVRLITPQERQGVIGYELAHERLIPALLRQTQKELTDVERARQMLDRRVNEWLGNQRDNRYYFNFRELWLIRKQRPYLDWGVKRGAKERLIRLSQRQVYGEILAVFLTLSVSLGLVSWFYFTPIGQLQGMYWQLDRQLANAGADQVTTAAVAFAKNDQWAKALDLTQSRLQPQGMQPSVAEDAAMARFVGEAADGLTRSTLSQDMQRKWLQPLLECAQAIQNSRSKSSALSAIATAYAQLEEEQIAADLLQSALQSVQAIEEDRSKSYALSSLATATVHLEDEVQIEELLQQVLVNIQTIRDDWSKSSALTSLATATARLQDKANADKLLQAILTSTQTLQNDWSRPYVLSAIALSYDQLQNKTKATELIHEALTNVETIKLEWDKSFVLVSIANAVVRMQDRVKAAELLQTALISAQTLQLGWYKSNALSAIANAYTQLKDNVRASKLLQTAFTNAQTIENDDSRSLAFIEIIAAAARLQDEGIAAELLQAILSNTQTIQYDGNKSYVLSYIAIATAQLENREKAIELLQSVLTSIQVLQRDEAKSYGLNSIAAASWSLKSISLQKSLFHLIENAAQRGKHGETIRRMVALYAQQGRWNHALSLLRGYGSVNSFAELLTIQVENRNPKLISGAVVLSASAEGNSLEVTIQSSDYSCEQRASWWEVITPDGELVARQLIDTIHRDKQPFTNQLSSVNLNPDQEVLIRAYFWGSYGYDSNLGRDRTGYTDQALRGSIDNGFKSVRISPYFARWLENDEPQPGKCEG